MLRSIESVAEIEKEREYEETLYTPTPEIFQKQEKKRCEEGISEFMAVKFIPPMFRRDVFDANNMKCRKVDRVLRKYYDIGRGMEYAFGARSFFEVVVGFRYRKRLPGKKKQQWSKKPYFFTGVVGPLVWDPKKKENIEKRYVVKFFDGDHRRFGVTDLERFLVRAPLLGEFDFLNVNLQN